MFTLPPRADEPGVLLALVREDGEARSAEEVEELLRHSAWVTEERGATCTHLRGVGGAYVLRHPKGKGVATIEMECSGGMMKPQAAATLAAAYEVAHGVVAGSAATQPRRGTSGGSGDVRRMEGGNRAKAEKAGGRSKASPAPLIGYDADVYNQVRRRCLPLWHKNGATSFTPRPRAPGACPLEISPAFLHPNLRRRRRRPATY